MLSKQGYRRLTLIGACVAASALLIVLGFGRLFALHGPSAIARTTATNGATATLAVTATALPTPAYDSGHPLSWSPVTFPSAAAAFALTPADENTSYACVSQPVNSGSSFGFWASHDRGVTWAHVGDVPTHQNGGCTVVMDALAVGTAIVYLGWYDPGASPLDLNLVTFATTDGGHSWAQLTGAFEYLQMASYRGTTYAIRLGVPLDLDTGEHLVVSTDGMRSWHAVEQTMANAKAVPHAFWLDPTDGSLLANAFSETSDGITRSLWASTNGGSTWRRLTSPDNGMRYLAVQSPATGSSRRICASDQDITAPPDQQYNYLACTQDGGATWVDRPALNVALSCETCLKGHPYTPIATLALVDIAPDGSLFATAADRFDADGAAHLSLFRLAPVSTRWESLGGFPGTDPNNTDVHALPSGRLWFVGSGAGFTGTEFNSPSFYASSGVYTAIYP